jgi:hypothetical protein
MMFQDVGVVVAGLLLALVVFIARAPVVRLLAPPETTQRDAALMSALVPKGLAAAVLASLTVQAEIPYAELVQGTVYAAIFFSILICAALIFVLERGMLTGVTEGWFRKFAVEPAVTEERGLRDSGLLIQPALIEFEPGLQEPNPVDLQPPPPPSPTTPDDTGREETS